MNEATIDILVHPTRWIGNTQYRNRMLARPVPPHTWRFVCRDPETGGIQVVACVAFMLNGKRVMRQPLRMVRR